jgi:hypothetical protein
VSKVPMVCPGTYGVSEVPMVCPRYLWCACGGLSLFEVAEVYQRYARGG